MSDVECKVCGIVLKSDMGLIKHLASISDHPCLDEYRRIYEDKINLKMDYIIPVANLNNDGYDHRLRNLETIVRIMPQNFHLIIVEQMLDTTLPLYTNDVRFPSNKSVTKILVRYPIFNKSWLYNVGVRNSKTDHVLLTEGDISVDINYFPELFSFATKKPKNKVKRWFFAWNKIIYWDNTFTEQIRVDVPRPGMAEGGIVYFNKDAYWEIGGANEWFQELGGIDNELALRAKHNFKCYNMFEWTINHLWHPISHVKKDKWINGTHRLNNGRIYNSTKKDPDKMLRFLRKYVGNAGSIKEPLCKNTRLEI